MAKKLFSWQRFNSIVVLSNMDNAFIQNKINVGKKTPVRVFDVFFFFDVKHSPVHQIFYDGRV